jgi:hypothetical protein
VRGFARRRPLVQFQLFYGLDVKEDRGRALDEWSGRAVTMLRSVLDTYPCFRFPTRAEEEFPLFLNQTCPRPHSAYLTDYWLLLVLAPQQLYPQPDAGAELAPRGGPFRHVELAPRRRGAASHQHPPPRAVSIRNKPRAGDRNVRCLPARAHGPLGVGRARATRPWTWSGSPPTPDRRACRQKSIHSFFAREEHPFIARAAAFFLREQPRTAQVMNHAGHRHGRGEHHREHVSASTFLPSSGVHANISMGFHRSEHVLSWFFFTQTAGAASLEMRLSALYVIKSATPAGH